MPQPLKKHTLRRTAELPSIFIPSRGRPKSSTVKLLRESGVPFILVIEEPEEADYGGECGVESLWVLPESNQGIAYVRNYIKNIATNELSLEWYWMLDDDLTGFFVVENSRLKRTDPLTVLKGATKKIQRAGRVGQGALEYGQFAWSAKKEEAFGYCDVAVLINTRRTQGINYRKEMELKEDRDFTLQVASAGWLTMRATRFAFTAPKNGSNPGGLKEVYAQAGREHLASMRMAEKWPGICTLNVKKGGRPDVKVNWKAFRPS